MNGGGEASLAMKVTYEQLELFLLSFEEKYGHKSLQ